MTELFRHVRLIAKTNYFSFCIWAQAAHVLLVKEPKLPVVGQKGVIFIAIYHFEAKMISRGSGRSAAAAAAYASCSRIYNDYDGVQHDYTRKRGCVYSEVFLPPNAPEEWKDRSELWNAVEAAEKSKDSRLARELIVALPIEVGIDEWKAILKDFVQEHCVSKGMCADVNIHDTDGHNPHAHILLTVRPLDQKGKWQAKTQKEYLCKRGDEERGFTAAEFKTAQTDGWEKQYQYKVGKKKIYMTPSEAEAQNLERVSKNPKSTHYGRQNPICAEWNSEGQILKWRKAWEEAVNKSLEQKNIDACIDCRSFKDRDFDEQPTIHEGVTARIIEQRGSVSERCELNRQIRADNKLLRELKAHVKKLTEALKNTVPSIAALLENIRASLVIFRCRIKFNSVRIKGIEQDKKKIVPILKRYDKIKFGLKQKNAERKKLQTEKKSLGSVRFVQQNQLERRIAKVIEEIEELKSERKYLLSELYCQNDTEVSELERHISDNAIVLEKLNNINSDLSERYNTEKARYFETQSTIPQEDKAEVNYERQNIRDKAMTEAAHRLKKIYGKKYDNTLLKRSETEVNRELNDLQPKKSIRQKLTKAEQIAQNKSAIIPKKTKTVEH